MTLRLTEEEQAMLAGEAGEGSRLALRLIVDLARIVGAKELVPIASAHVDGCMYHGRVSTDFVDRLLASGGRVSVPTTLNVGSVDLLHPDRVHGETDVLSAARCLMEGYERLGATPTWTCAPYQSTDRPRFGQQIAWAESNAIVFANSVLGARTERYGDFTDIAAAISGRAPLYGLHLDENRVGGQIFDLAELPEDMVDDDFSYPLIGFLIGRLSGATVPVLDGIPPFLSEDRLKALGAAAASSGRVALFHVVGSTPEAPDLASALGGGSESEWTRLSAEDLRRAYVSLCSVNDGRIDAVSLGTPHFSGRELVEVAAMLESHSDLPRVPIYVSISRAVYELARQSGLADRCEARGITLVTDTCTYVTSILPPDCGVVMTNSAKWAYYAPSNIGVEVIMADLDTCIRSALTGTAEPRTGVWST